MTQWELLRQPRPLAEGLDHCQPNRVQFSSVVYFHLSSFSVPKVQPSNLINATPIVLMWPVPPLSGTGITLLYLFWLQYLSR